MPLNARPMPLAEALTLARTGDIWLFRGRTAADRAIQTFTNSPVNHVGMALVLEDLPPLIWHAEMGRSLPDVWSGQRTRGAQLHTLEGAVLTWANRYRQRAWFRQLSAELDRAAEDAALRTVARLDGTPFPSTTGVLGRWLAARTTGSVLASIHSARSRLRTPRQPAGSRLPEPAGAADPALETAYCAEVVALTYQAMGLLAADRSPSWYDPGQFWSGDDLALTGGARLGAEIEVDVPGPDWEIPVSPGLAAGH